MNLGKRSKSFPDEDIDSPTYGYYSQLLSLLTFLLTISTTFMRSWKSERSLRSTIAGSAYLERDCLIAVTEKPLGPDENILLPKYSSASVTSSNAALTCVRSWFRGESWVNSHELFSVCSHPNLKKLNRGILPFYPLSYNERWQTEKGPLPYCWFAALSLITQSWSCVSFTSTIFP